MPLGVEVERGKAPKSHFLISYPWNSDKIKEMWVHKDQSLCSIILWAAFVVTCFILLYIREITLEDENKYDSATHYDSMTFQ